MSDSLTTGYVDLRPEELLAAARLVGLWTPDPAPGLGDVGAGRMALARSGAESLLDRGLVRRVDHDTEIDIWLADMLLSTRRADLVINVVAIAGAMARSSWIYVLKSSITTVAVGESPEDVRIRALPVDALAAVLVAEVRSRGVGGAFDAHAADPARDELDRQMLAEVLGELAAKRPAPDPELLAQLPSEVESIRLVTSMWKEDDAPRMGAVAFIRTAAGALQLVDTSGDDMELQPVTEADVLAAIRECQPNPRVLFE